MPEKAYSMNSGIRPDGFISAFLLQMKNQGNVPISLTKSCKRNRLMEKTMIKNVTVTVLSWLLLFLLGGCGGKDTDITAYKGAIYPPTSKIEYIFQSGQAAQECRVFAELLITLPAGADGKLIKQKIEEEAKARGAQTVLIGQSRQMEDDEGYSFIYYGPEKEYLCNEQWCGWKYGYDAWEEQGEFVNIGYQEWGNPNVRLDYPVMLQAVFLRCR